MLGLLRDVAGFISSLLLFVLHLMLASARSLLSAHSQLFTRIAQPQVHMSQKLSGATAVAAASVYSTHVSKIEARSNIPQEAQSNPHHVLKNNDPSQITGFKNPFPSYAPPRIFEQVMWPLLVGRLKYPDTTPPTVNVVQPQFLPSRFASASLRATWLGHACYYVEYPSGLRALFDPVFEKSCSPWFAQAFGPKRFTPRPCDIKDIPTVDAIFISHSHYDHLSAESVGELRKYHPEAQYFVGLGLEKWFRRKGFKNVTEMDWWQDADLTIKIPSAKKDIGDGASTEAGVDETMTIEAKVSCLPSQHNSARGIFDKDQTLWCSWGVRSGNKNVWFGGDTGYRAVPETSSDTDDWGPEYEKLPRNPQFKQIGDLRGPFDLGLIPIGAYAPRVAFSGMHANPFDAVEIFRDTKCKRAMGIHWGTWALTTEEVLEPPRLLREALKRRGIPETGKFDICDIGESREFTEGEGSN